MVTLLIVEDEKTVRLLTKAKLSPSYRILEAENGEAAWQILEHNHVDLLMVDIMMPTPSMPERS